MNTFGNMKNILFVLTLGMLLFSCKSTHQSPYDYTKDKLSFGTGGGFSGKVTEYTLLSNGEFYKGTSNEGSVYKLNHNQNDRVDMIFKNYETLNFSELDINEAGNMYNYIVMYKEGEEPHKILWADYVEGVPNELKIYFKNLKSFAKELNLKQSKKEQPLK